MQKIELKEFDVYRDNTFYKRFRVTTTLIVDIIKQLEHVYGREFKAINRNEKKHNQTNTIILCK